MTQQQPVLALDVGGTKLAAGVVARDGTVQSYCQVETTVDEGPTAVVKRLLDLGEQAATEAGIPLATLPGNTVTRRAPGPPAAAGPITGAGPLASAGPLTSAGAVAGAGALAAVGVGCGGPLEPSTGVILGPPGLPGWDAVPLGRLVAERFGLPTYVENDATAAALGEYRWGGWGVENLVYLTVSTGFGGGIVTSGKLFHGAARQGGELGHVVIDWQGRQCGCGARGCAEAYVSGTSIARRAAEAAAGTDSPLAGLQPTAKDVAEQARAGDPVARAVWDETTAMLGRMVAVLINVCEPELVVLGGGVTRAGAQLLDPVREAALRQAMPPAARACDVALSRHGDAVGVLGAAAIAYERLGES